MIDRKSIIELLEDYDLDKVKIGVIGSHSALDTCDGAVQEGFHTLAVCQEGRESPYSRYFRAHRDRSGKLRRGMVDEVMLLPKFRDIMKEENMKRLRSDNILFIPNRSFTSYVSMDAVEDDFMVPLVGSRNLLRSEDRGGPKDYYWLLEKAGMPFPRKITDPKDINFNYCQAASCSEKLERGFFTCASYKEYKENQSS